MKKISRYWKIIYAACSLVYMVWVIQAGDIEFDRIISQHRLIVLQLDKGRIKTAALEELIQECRRQARGSLALMEADCYSWSEPIINAREKEIQQRLTLARKRSLIKLVLFYVGFIFIFLLAPPVIFFLFLAGTIKIYQSVQFVKNENGSKEKENDS